MSDEYQVTETRPVTDRDPATHRVVDGYHVSAIDNETQSVVSTFVPASKASPEGTHALIMHEIGKVRAIHKLPGSLPPAG